MLDCFADRWMEGWLVGLERERDEDGNKGLEDSEELEGGIYVSAYLDCSYRRGGLRCCRFVVLDSFPLFVEALL